MFLIFFVVKKVKCFVKSRWKFFQSISMLTNSRYFFQRYVAYTGNNMRKLPQSPEKDKDMVRISLLSLTWSEICTLPKSP